ncbi:MAG: hypothetical protein ABSG93_18940 [Solirubrobacteraceae bacterium]
MTVETLVRVFGGWPCVPDAVPALAESLDEILDRNELAGVYADASELAARLDLPFPIRRLAATVGCAAEAALARGLAPWNLITDVLEAGEAVRAEGL